MMYKPYVWNEEEEKGKKNKKGWIILAVIVVIVGMFLCLILSVNARKKVATEVPVLTATATTTPTVAWDMEADRDNFQLSIGGGKSIEVTVSGEKAKCLGEMYKPGTPRGLCNGETLMIETDDPEIMLFIYQDGELIYTEELPAVIKIQPGWWVAFSTPPEPTQTPIQILGNP